jgi:hypothetical protein
MLVRKYQAQDELKARLDQACDEAITQGQRNAVLIRIVNIVLQQYYRIEDQGSANRDQRSEIGGRGESDDPVWKVRESLADKSRARELEREICLAVCQAVRPLIRPFPPGNLGLYEVCARRFFRRWRPTGGSPHASSGLLGTMLDSFENVCIERTLEPPAVRVMREIIERKLRGEGAGTASERQ